MRRSSLLTRIYRRVLLLLALAGLVMGAILYTVAGREIGRASDAQLVNASRLLYMMMRDDLAAGILKARGGALTYPGDPILSAEERNAFHASFDWCMFAVFWDGKPVAQSGWGAPIGLVPRAAGFHDFTAMEDRWRSYGLPGHDRRLLVVVAERKEIREFSIVPVLRQLTVPMLLLFAAGMITLWWTLRKSLSEVDRLTSTLHLRSLADLAPLEPTDWSSDLAPLIMALNTLFARLGEAYGLEQAFTDDVAHELRTPLAAIKAQAQLVSRTTPAPADSEIYRLVKTVDRANDLIDGMLILARLNATTVSIRSIDIHDMVAEVVAEAMLNASADGMEFTVSPDHMIRWRCDPAALKIALSAVIDNAIRHAHDGRHIDIALNRSAEQLVITIGDRGCGVAPADRERLLRRFERGTSGSPGSGLGLSIAVKAMTMAGGTIRLEDRQEGSGLLVILTIAAALE